MDRGIKIGDKVICIDSHSISRKEIKKGNVYTVRNVIKGWGSDIDTWITVDDIKVNWKIIRFELSKDEPESQNYEEWTEE